MHEKIMFLFIIILTNNVSITPQNAIKKIYTNQFCDTNSNNINCAKKLHKILEIEEIKIKNGVYIIHGRDEKDRLYTILSKRKKTNDSKKISIGDKYQFYLVPYLDRDCYPELENSDMRIINSIGFGFTIRVENKEIKINLFCDNNFYGTPNLQGLYYITYEGNEDKKKYLYYRSCINWVRDYMDENKL